MPLLRAVSDRDDEPIESPPEGASCAEHPERPAAVICPRCGNYACLACWHMTVRRCHACLMRDPAAAAPPIPWETQSNVFARFFGTLATAVRPGASAPAFARGEVRPAVVFALLSFLPLALVEGVIPYTATLLFGDRFGVRLIGTPTTNEIALDVARAVGLGLTVALVRAAVLAIPYYSLSRAYGDRGHAAAPLRLMLYRLWLVPFSGVVFGLFLWGLPGDSGESLGMYVQIVQLVPLLLLLSSMLSTARMASGVGPLAAFAVALVPFVLFFLLEGLKERALAPLLPDPEMLRQAAASVLARG